MKYMLLIYTEESTNPPPEVVIPEHIAFAKDALAKGAYVSCDGLESPTQARTVRIRAGDTLTTDGPFAETKEVLGGYYIVECEDIDAACRYAAAIPGAKNGCIEVRPIAVIPGWEEAIGIA
jgi:hypothetical protein